MKKITFEDCCYSLKNTNIVPGDLVLVHSSLNSIGKIEGGAETLIDAFLHVLGPEGTLAMPSMTDPFKAFDAKTSKSNVGYLTEAFRNYPGAVRSLFPVHSVSAVGKRAEEFCSGHNDCDSGCGAGSPFYKIWQWDGKIVLLGVDQDRNTTLHAFENESKVSYFMNIDIPAPTYEPYFGKGTFRLKDFPEGHRSFITISSDLRENGLITYGKLGNAVIQVMEAKKIHDFLIPKLKEDPYYFLCDNPNCDFCNRARRGEAM